MEQPEPNKASIRGKDLVGGIKVMPMGLDAAIKKRTSGEFKSEQRGGALNFSHENQETKMESFKEESSGFNQVSSMKSSAMQSSSMQSSSMQSSSFQSSSSSKQMSSAKQMSSSSQMTSSNQMSSSAMSMSSQKSMSSMTSSKNISSESNSVSFQSSEVSKQDAEQICDSVTKPLIHNQEIEQEVLKTQIVSAISDLEGDRDFVDFGRDNKPIDLTSPPMTNSPTPKTTFTPTKQDPFSPSKQDVFSPPPLEPMEPPKPQPVLTTSKPAEFTPPTRNGIQNGFSEFTSSSQNLEVQTIQESSQSQSFQMNGTHEESGSIQGSSSSSSLLQKIMTPAPVEYDTGSLKRRDPRKMFTDSSFYNAAHHPTVADQVEMAHRLSSAMFNDKNSSSKGQKMYLTRVQNSGGMHDDDYQNRHDTVPNMKLVMNPEGKVHEWDDLPEDQKPDYQQIAVHAAPNVPLPDVADPVAESLNAGIGKGGELFAKRRQRAENWVVDETSIGQAKPSAFADKFMQEQTQQQLAFQQQKQLEQQQREQISQQQISQQQSELFQQQQESKQTFIQQQQFKQEQSLEIRRQQEEQARMAQQQMELPPNYKHTDLKARSFTPSLDLGVHNVQGINVWANTAPRGWSTSYQRTKATPPKSDPPTVSVCPATPSLDTEIIQQRMQETKIAEQEEQMRMQQEQQMQMQMQMQQEEQMRMQMEQQEQIRVQEENMRLQQQQEEMRRQQEEQMRIQQQQEEQMKIQQQQEENMRLQQQQEEMIRQQEEQMRIQQQQQEQMKIQQQQEEQMRIQQQQEEQRRIQQQQEEQLRIQQQQEEQMRIQRQQEEQMRIQQQQEEQRRIQMQQEEEARAAAEMRRQQEEAERQRQEQMQRQQQEEQMRIQQQQEEQRRIQIQQQEAAERQRQEQIERQEMERQQQLMMQQQSMSQISSSSTTTKSGGFAVESRPEPLLSESQLAQPPMSSSSLFESSQSQGFAQQSSSIQQSSSSFSQSQSSKEVYESQQFSGGVMKGYTLKQDQASEQRETGEKMLNSGVFGGIGADNNSLVDSEVDYKKHTVKDLAKHFALVKPKADIPHAILPEQRIYNGDQGPALNYLGASAQGSSSSTQSFMKKEISQEDFEASKKAYEMKKKQQQMESQQQSQSGSSQSTVVRRTETSSSSEQSRSVLNERRQSLTTSLMLDPAAAHAESGIIDPSAILRGSDTAGTRSRSEGLFGQTAEPGETDKILNKWDNHNAIARGWGGVKENYHPVTFRGIYNVDSQTQNL